jgi:hypothetical protein
MFLHCARSAPPRFIAREARRRAKRSAFGASEQIDK